MVVGWIARLLGGGELQVDKRIGEDLGRLNKAKTGLADKAIRYVMTGEGGEVLSTLATIDPTEIFGRGWSSHDPIRFGRATWLVRSAPDAATALRYADVIAALERDLATLPGFADTPTALRAFVKAAAVGYHDAETQPRKLYTGSVVATPAFLVDLTSQAGAKLVDLWGVLFAFNERWHYGERQGRIIRQALDFAPLVRANSETVVVAAKRLSADGRVDLIEQFGKWKVLDVPALRQVVLTALGDSAKSVREAARGVLKLEPEAALLADLAPLMSSGQSQVRQSAAEILAGLKVPGVGDLFTAHLPSEKVSAVRAIMDTALRVQTMPATEEVVSKDAGEQPGYVALDGSFVAIPPMKAVETARTVILGEADIAALNKLVRAENDRRVEFNKTSKWKQQPLSADTAKKAVAFLNGGPWQNAALEGLDRQFVFYQMYDKWLKPALARLPLATGLGAIIKLSSAPDLAFREQGWGPGSGIIDYVQLPGADFRILDKLHVEGQVNFSFGGWTARSSRPCKPGDVLRSILEDTGYGGMTLGPIPPEAVWPYLAEQLDIFAEAFGLKAPGTPSPDKLRAVELLTFLPKTPRDFLGPLLDIATGSTKTGRKTARALLKGAPGLTEIVCSLLKDGRQESRAGAARWLGEIGDPSAIAALTEALKTEKSEVARAGMLGALRALGAPIDHYVGPKALLSEAQALLKKAKTDKLDWLLQGGLPALQFADGSKVPDDVPRGWVVLATKLKQPGGNALFDLYLDQLAPASAEKLSTHLLDAWINYDTETPSHEEANAHAQANAQSRYSQYVRWDKDYTVEKAFRDLYNEKRGTHLNSGAETKGLLGLAVRAAPSHAAAQVRSYLKKHGARTAQTSALLEMLAAMADPVTLQVVIAAATRLKQKTVQAHAASLVQTVAEQRNWTMDELADRTVPTAGLNDDGALELPCGPEEKVYTARLDGELKFALFNPDGKAVSALPSGDDEQTKASKALLDTDWLDAVASALAGSLAQVFRGLAASAADTLLDLGISARAGAAPRLASELLALSNMATLARERSARFDPPEFLARLARTYALTEAIRTRSDDEMLTGTSRRDFVAAEPLFCLVLGAERWATQSGARGMTLHLWDVAARRRLRVTQARAGGADPDFTPTSAYRMALWGLQPPSSLVGHLLEIAEPFLAEDGSLSPSRCAGAKILRPLRIADLGPGGASHDSWSALLEAGQVALGTGLARSAVPVTAVLERPANGTVALDDIAQTYMLNIADPKGQVEPVAIKAETPTEAAALASLVHGSAAILVQLIPGWNGITLSLVSVLCPDGDGLTVVNPGLDPLPNPTRMQQLIERASRVFQRAQMRAQLPGQSFGERVLSGLGDLWQAGPPAGLVALAAEAEARQMLTLARVLERLEVRADGDLTLVAAYVAGEMAYCTTS